MLFYEKTKKINISAWGFIVSVLGAVVVLDGIWGFPTQMNKYGRMFLILFLLL